MNFKEMMDRDLDRTIYNTREFAQTKRIRCDGIDKKIPVIFDLQETEERKGLLSGDHAEGIWKDQTIIRIRLSDLGKEPEQGTRLWVDSELFVIAGVRNEYNELILGLERAEA